MTTTRETADHAELLTAKACGDRMLAVADALMPWLKNYPPSTRRERAIEAANAAIAASSAPLLSEIAALRGERTFLMEQKEGAEDAIFDALTRLTQAERQRDEAVGLLREVCIIQNNGDLDARIFRAIANQGTDQ
ncbi:hypothetical protein [Brevundimonas bullata]